MTELGGANSERGQELFRCRAKPLLRFFVLRYQGSFPPPPALKSINRLVILSPFLEPLVLAGIPLVLAVFLFEFVFGLKPPNRPAWLVPFCLAVLAVSLVIAIWWFWISPQKDSVIVHEQAFRWRISLCRNEWFRSQGSITTIELEAFSYRTDCFDREPVGCGKSTADKLTRILLELNLSRHDLGFHFRNGEYKIIERFFARFEPDDLKQFLAHLATIAEARLIAVQSPASEAVN